MGGPGIQIPDQTVDFTAEVIPLGWLQFSQNGGTCFSALVFLEGAGSSAPGGEKVILAFNERATIPLQFAWLATPRAQDFQKSLL